MPQPRELTGLGKTFHEVDEYYRQNFPLNVTILTLIPKTAYDINGISFLWVMAYNLL